MASGPEHLFRFPNKEKQKKTFC